MRKTILFGLALLLTSTAHADQLADWRKCFTKTDNGSPPVCDMNMDFYFKWYTRDCGAPPPKLIIDDSVATQWHGQELQGNFKDMLSAIAGMCTIDEPSKKATVALVRTIKLIGVGMDKLNGTPSTPGLFFDYDKAKKQLTIGVNAKGGYNTTDRVSEWVRKQID